MLTQVGRNEAASVEVRITNETDQSVQLLSWYLPDADLQEPLFAVTRDGQPVSYIGPLYKRAQPDASDYVTLAPGATLTRTVDLAKFYDISTTGDYTVKVAIDDAKLRGQPGVVVSPIISAQLEGNVRAPAEKPSRDTCTAAQHADIDAALPIAKSYSDAAASYLAGSPSSTPRYTTWFGALSTTGWNKAHNDFVAISNGFATNRVIVDCSCKQKNVYAYVNPANPYLITVCGAFWTAPLSGTDSKAGTFVHEMSHFNVTASTDDWAYGKTACMSLAQSDPTKALDNADSHEYFAENTPAQP